MLIDRLAVLNYSESSVSDSNFYQIYKKKSIKYHSKTLYFSLQLFIYLFVTKSCLCVPYCVRILFNKTLFFMPFIEYFLCIVFVAINPDKTISLHSNGNQCGNQCCGSGPFFFGSGSGPANPVFKIRIRIRLTPKRPDPTGSGSGSFLDMF